MKLNSDTRFCIGDDALEGVVVSLGDEATLMLTIGSGNLDRLGVFGSDITVSFFGGDVAVGDVGGRRGLSRFGASNVGDLAAFFAGTGGICDSGMLRTRFCSR